MINSLMAGKEWHDFYLFPMLRLLLAYERYLIKACSSESNIATLIISDLINRKYQVSRLVSYLTNSQVPHSVSI